MTGPGSEISGVLSSLSLTLHLSLNFHLSFTVSSLKDYQLDYTCVLSALLAPRVLSIVLVGISPMSTLCINLIKISTYFVYGFGVSIVCKQLRYCIV